MLNKPKLLISAYRCLPNQGSEDEVGFQWIKNHISKNKFEIFILTQSKNKAIESFINLKKNKIKIIYHDLSMIPHKRKRSGLKLRVYYYLWQLSAYHVIKRNYGKDFFQFIHHVTFCSIKYPIFLSFLKANFIFGPIGGGEISPIKFYKGFDLLDKFKEAVRLTYVKCMFFFPFVFLTFLNSKIIYVANKETKNSIPNFFSKKIKLMTQIGLANDKVINNNNKKNFRILFVGRFIQIKGIDIIIDILKNLPSSFDYSMTFVGAGKYKSKIINFKNHNKSKVNLIDHVDNSKMLSFMSKFDLLLFPSLRDSGGFVVIEAIKAGIKVLCLNLGGPGLLLSRDNGIKIDANSGDRLTIIKKFVNEILRLNALKDKKKLKSNKISNSLLWKNKVNILYKDLKNF